MDMKSYLELVAKFFAVLTEACKFFVITVLSILIVAAIAQPAWARQKLTDMGLSVKEVNMFGVKLASNEAFDMAKTLAEARNNITVVQAQLGNTPGTTGNESLAKAVTQMDKLQASLVKQSETLANIQGDCT